MIAYFLFRLEMAKRKVRSILSSTEARRPDHLVNLLVVDFEIQDKSIRRKNDYSVEIVLEMERYLIDDEKGTIDARKP